MKKITFIFICLFFLGSCAGVREGFTLKKKSSVDEFLVEKKSPLVLPPKYGELPLPDEDIIEENKDENTDVKVTLGGEKIEIDLPIKNSKPTSLEKSVLEKIK